MSCEILTQAQVECEFSLRIKDEAFKTGTVRVHLPAPINASWLFMGMVLKTSPEFRMISTEDQPQRTIWFDENLKENMTFSVKYAFDADTSPVVPDIEKINETAKLFGRFTKEKIDEWASRDHCDCTTYTGEAFERVMIADFAPEKEVKLLSAADLDALKNKGFLTAEKGVGSILKSCFDLCAGENFDEAANCVKLADSRNTALVSLLRSVGIPARWQGGLRLKDGQPVAADWTIAHVEPYGWIYMDAQAAHEAHQIGDDKAESFYFGGIDACRIPTASRIGAAFYPACDFERSDPLYNLHGEVEYEDRALAENEIVTTVTMNVT